MSKETQSEAQPKVVQLDMGQMLAALLQAQAETAKINRQLLDIQLRKDKAAEEKEEALRLRLERERDHLHAQMRIKLANDERRWKQCPHTDQLNGSTIYPISNFPDRLLRGTCTQCGIFIQPEHVEVDANGKKTVIPKHPLYDLVLQRDQKLYGQFVSTTGY